MGCKKEGLKAEVDWLEGGRQEDDWIRFKNMNIEIDSVGKL